jgi:hypothetical protein
LRWLAAVVPASAVVAGRGAYQAAARAEQVSAVLITGVPSPALSAHGLPLVAEVPAHWVAPNGAQHGGEIAAPPGARAGSTVTTWLNASGQPVGAPLNGGQVAGRGVAAGLLAGAGVALVVLAAWLVARRWLDRRRLAVWGAAWRLTAARWTTPR